MAADPFRSCSAQLADVGRWLLIVTHTTNDAVRGRLPAGAARSGPAGRELARCVEAHCFS